MHTWPQLAIFDLKNICIIYNDVNKTLLYEILEHLLIQKQIIHKKGKTMKNKFKILSLTF